MDIVFIIFIILYMFTRKPSAFGIALNTCGYIIVESKAILTTPEKVQNIQINLIDFTAEKST